MKSGRIKNPVKHTLYSSKKYLRGNVFFIFCLLIVILVMGGFTFYFGTQRNQQQIPTEQVQKTTTAVLNQNPPSSTMSLTKLSDAWNLGTRTYSNKKINITFNFPSYFEIVETDIQKENKEWEDKYKNTPNITQPLYRSNFLVKFYTPNQELATDQFFCDNKMSVIVQQYINPQNISLFDFIADLNKTYSGDGQPESFDTYKKSLTQSQLPKDGSYLFTGVIGENPVKEIYFTNKDKIYKFHLSGNCNTGGQYTQDAETVFDNILKSIKYL